MMMRVLWVALCVMGVMASGSAFAASKTDLRDCRSFYKDVDQGIAACTRILEAEGGTIKNRVEAYYYRGLAYHNKGDIDLAIADFDEVIILDPRHLYAHGARGNAYAGKGELDRAIEDYDEAIRINPKFSESTYQSRGAAYRAKGDFDQALADYDTAIRSNPKIPAFLYERGITLFIQGSMEGARADLQKAYEFARKSNFKSWIPYPALWLEIVERRNGEASRLAERTRSLKLSEWPAPLIRLVLGEATVEETVAAANDAPNALVKQWQVCQANFFAGEKALLDSAEDEAKRLLRLAAGDCPQVSGEGIAAAAELEALGAVIAADWNACQSEDSDEAIAACTKVLESKEGSDEDRAAAFWTRGAAHRSKNELDQALADLGEAIRLAPTKDGYFNSRGIVHNIKGDHDRAIADFDEAIRLNPKNAIVFANRGAVYIEKGDFDHAVADFGEVIRIAPEDPDNHVQRGLAYYVKGELDRAIADYGEAIRLDPKHGDAYLNRGIAFLALHSFSEAQADFKQVRDIAPTYPYGALWLNIAERRGGLIPDFLTPPDQTEWPAPIVRHFVGEATVEQMLSVANEAADPQTKRWRLCEARFFGGELALSKGATSEAKRLFRLAADDCPPSSTIRFTATAELKALGDEALAAPAPAATDESSDPTALTATISATEPAPAAPAAVASDTEIAFWNTIAQSKDPADFEAYLAQYPNGVFARLAQNRLKSLSTQTGAPAQ